MCECYASLLVIHDAKYLFELHGDPQPSAPSKISGKAKVDFGDWVFQDCSLERTKPSWYGDYYGEAVSSLTDRSNILEVTCWVRPQNTGRSLLDLFLEGA